MAVSYNRLWKTLIDRGMKRSDLRDAVGMSTSTLAKMGRNEYVSLQLLDRICIYLNCDLCDVIQIVHDSNKDDKSA